MHACETPSPDSEPAITATGVRPTLIGFELLLRRPGLRAIHKFPLGYAQVLLGYAQGLFGLFTGFVWATHRFLVYAPDRQQVLCGSPPVWLSSAPHLLAAALPPRKNMGGLRL
jgi:hypothetical protein